MEINSIRTSHLRNGEHYEFFTGFDKLVAKSGAIVLGIETLYHDFKPLLESEAEAFNIVKGSAVTDEITDSDAARDNTFRGLINANKSNLTHFLPAVKKASQNLMPVFGLLGNITKKPYDEETADIRDLCNKLLGSYLPDTTAAGLLDWVNRLKTDNESFEELKNKRFTEASAKTQKRMTEVRLQTDKVYQQIVKRINALIIINGDATYKEFVTELNNRIESSMLILAQRKGRNAKDDDTEAPENI